MTVQCKNCPHLLDYKNSSFRSCKPSFWHCAVCSCTQFMPRNKMGTVLKVSRCRKGWLSISHLSKRDWIKDATQANRPYGMRRLNRCVWIVNNDLILPLCPRWHQRAHRENLISCQCCCSKCSSQEMNGQFLLLVWG